MVVKSTNNLDTDTQLTEKFNAAIGSSIDSATDHDQIPMEKSDIYEATEQNYSPIINENSLNLSNIRVPISLTLFILTTYILFGGALFMTIEGNLFDIIYGNIILCISKFSFEYLILVY